MRISSPLLVTLLVGVAPLAGGTARAQTFTDATGSLPLVEDVEELGGATVADVDGDGRTDLYVPDRAQGGVVYLQRDGSFEAVGAAGGAGALIADADGDGLRDVLQLDAPRVARYDVARQRVTDAFVLPVRPSTLVQSSLWFDYNSDGRLDVYVGNDIGKDYVFEGDGGGTFEDVSPTALPGLNDANNTGTYGAAAADYDRDGAPDVYVSYCSIGEGNQNSLLRNDGGVFADVGVDVGASGMRPSWGVVWLDYDNDGLLDLAVANMPVGGTDGYEELFHNGGDGTFKEVAGAVGVAGDTDGVSFSVAAADFDNDGWLDLFVADFRVGNPTQASRLLRNNGDGSFSDITAEAGLSDLSSTIVAVGDVDGDGWVDLLAPRDGDAQFFLNDGGTNGWLSVDLTGVASNPDGIGARVEVTAGDLQMVREITAGDGFMSQSHGLNAHFGLGSATSAHVTVRWPSGQVDVVEGVAASQGITVVEGVGLNRLPEPFALTSPSDGEVIPVGQPVTLAWETAADADAVAYTVHLAAPDGTNQTFETAEPTFTVPASSLAAEGSYRWAVVARDAYSTRTSLDNASFTNNPNVASEAEPVQATVTLEVWPNPARASTTVRFELPAPDVVGLDVYDVLGRRVRQVSLGTRSAGSHAEALDVSGLRAGAYVVRLRGTRGARATARFVRAE